MDILSRELTKVRFAFCYRINNNGMSIFMQTIYVKLCLSGYAAVYAENYFEF